MGRRWLLAGALCLALLGVPAAGASPSASPARPFVTGFVLSGVTDWDVELDRARGAGAQLGRLFVSWAAIVRSRPTSRAAARDPSSGNALWKETDDAVRTLAARGIEPVLSVAGAPRWAQARGPRPNGGALRPSPTHLADFVHAAALRYSGSFEGLPRVRYWQVWNEPNLTHFLNPQVERGRLVSPEWYRRMVNAVAASVKAVDASNMVIAGGLAPFECHGRRAQRSCGSAPFVFMRQLFCVSRRLRQTCSSRIRIDAWAHHAYTAGGPRKQAFRRDDASIGDLPEMKRVLDAAYRLGRIEAPRRPEFWVTEFSWDTRPPDRGGVPAGLHARWVAEALYRMWSAGVTRLTWWTIRDQPYPASPFQSGLWYRGRTVARDRPKPALQAFRFPFVALRDRGRVLVWGRTPDSRAGAVRIERSGVEGWRRVATLRADRYGIFSARLALSRPAAGTLRAVAGAGSASRSRPFALRVPKDVRTQPFGDFGIDVDR